jgi:uncharacterized membrane protein
MKVGANSVQDEVGWTDEKTEELVGELLRWGVTSAAVIVLSGAAVYLFRHGLQPANYRVFAGEPSDMREWRGIIYEATHGRGRAIIQLGLLVLLLTPVARVVFAAFAFAMERDWFYVGVSVFVFLVLLYSMAGSGI